MKVLLIFLLVVFFTASQSRVKTHRSVFVPLIVVCLAVAYALSTVRFAS